MCAKWAKDFDAAPLLKRIQSLAVVNAGNVTFQNAFEFHEYDSILAENVEFSPEMPEESREWYGVPL